jgi:hypothetical protein
LFAGEAKSSEKRQSSRPIRLPFDDSVKVYHVDSSAFNIIAGQPYTLSVHDGKRSVKATCTVPEKAPKIDWVKIEPFETGVTGSFENMVIRYSSLRISESWQDIAG